MPCDYHRQHHQHQNIVSKHPLVSGNLISFARIFETSAIWVKNLNLASCQHFEWASNLLSYWGVFYTISPKCITWERQCKVACRGNQNVWKLMFQVTALESHWSQPKGNSYQYFHMPACPQWRNKAFPRKTAELWTWYGLSILLHDLPEKATFKKEMRLRTHKKALNL